MCMVDPKEVHVLIPRACKCATLYAKRDSADVIKIMRQGEYPGIPKLALNMITMVLIRGRLESQLGRRRDDSVRSGMWPQE